MQSNQPEYLFKKNLEDFLLKQFGWKLDISLIELNNKIQELSKELKCEDSKSCMNLIRSKLNDKYIINIIASKFSITQSYFFRDREFTNYFKNFFIPNFLVQKKHLSIWSVGCSHGEEIYTLAMLLDTYIKDIEKYDIYLLGTDINNEALEIAKNGVYTEYALRDLPKNYQNYFTKDSNTYKLSKKIKEMVTFKNQNIINEYDSSFFYALPKFDLILIKNVLIYFDINIARNVINNLYNYLNDDGFIATTPTEFGMEIFNTKSLFVKKEAHLLQKKSLLPSIQPIELKEKIEFDPLEIEPKKPIKKENKIEDHSFEELSSCTKYNDALKKIDLDDIEGAKKDLQHALYLDQSDIMAHLVLSNLFKKEGNTTKALKHLRNAKILLGRMDATSQKKFAGGFHISDLLEMIKKIETKI